MPSPAPIKHYDLIIIGGGLAGQTLAYALKDLPHFRMAIIEPVPFNAKQQPSFDDRSLALNHISYRILVGLGLWPHIAADACPIAHVHVSDRGHFGHCKLDAHRYQVPALGYVVDIRTLGNALYPTLQAAPHIDFYCPAELLDLYSDSQQSYVTLQQGEQTYQITSRLTVGADGHYSKARQLMNLTTEQRDYQQNAIIANIQAITPHQGIAYERFTAQGPLALLPLTNNRFSLVWTVARGTEQSLLNSDEATFLQKLQQAFGYRAGLFSKAGLRHSYPLKLIHAEQVVKERFVLISNSAQNLHPIAGQGFNLGLRDIALLAEMIFDAHQAQQDIADGRLLQRYQQQRAADKQRVIRLTDGLTQLFSNQFPLLSSARGLALAVTDKLPWVKQAIARQAMGYSGSTPRLACGLTLQGEPCR